MKQYPFNYLFDEFDFLGPELKAASEYSTKKRTELGTPDALIFITDWMLVYGFLAGILWERERKSE